MCRRALSHRARLPAPETGTRPGEASINHATLCIAAHGFLIVERAALPPQENDAPHSSRYLDYPEVIDRETPSIRPERHVGNSIATLSRVIVRAWRAQPVSVLSATRDPQPFMTQ